jgi:hypothetical protein
MNKRPFIPEHVILEDQRRRQQEREERYQPIPLHAPTPWPSHQDADRPSRSPDEEENHGSTVIIIDISDLADDD